MKKTIEIKAKIKDKTIQKKLYRLNKMFLKSQDKVAYYYEDINHHIIFSFNENACFYSASTIKILVCLYIYEQASKNKINLEKEILIHKEDIKGGTGILKNEAINQKYTIKKLIEYTLVESDNTAYIKLVNFITKEKIIEFGKSLGAKHTLEGKDLFGITNCSDMRIYWIEIYRFIKEEKLGEEFKSFLNHPSYKIIELFNDNYFRKYGSFDIAFHECGFVEEVNPFLIFIMTQKGKLKNRKKFINKTAKQLYRIHKILQKSLENDEKI